MKKETFRKIRPWLFVLAAFLVLIAAWTWLISTAVKNQPEQIEIHSTPQPI